MPPAHQVAVIMPALNSECTVHLAIESVLTQTFSDWELLIVDDASTDCTRDVAETYAAVDRRVRVLHTASNSRTSPIQWEPRNLALAQCRSQLVAYLDADNTWRPSFLERLVSAVREGNQIALAYCDSCNHYRPSDTAARIASDRRMLKACGSDWTVFSNGPLAAARLGIDQYVDTNEMVHRFAVFPDIGGMWATAHPLRSAITATMFPHAKGRRHNDLELVGRIIDRFGISAVQYVDDVLVDYYYPGASRSQSPRQTASLADIATSHPLSSSIVLGSPVLSPGGHE